VITSLERANLFNFGGHLTELHVPDRNGQLADIVLGHSTLEPYLDHKTNPYFGSIVGRYANRIANGKFTLDGKQYTLDASSGGNHLHGGKMGFDLKVWKAEPMPDNPEGPALRLTYSSPDGGTEEVIVSGKPVQLTAGTPTQVALEGTMPHTDPSTVT
jgi:aldose 1-epimerase